MMTASATRRRILQSAGAAGLLSLAKAPAFAQATPKKLIFAHVTPPPESSAVAFVAMAKEVTERSNGELVMEFHGGTLLTKELEIINAVKSGNIAMGDPGGAAATVFPEMGVFLVPYLVASYDQAYKMFNGQVGERLDKQFQDNTSSRSCFSTITASAISGTASGRSPSPRICAASRCGSSRPRCSPTRSTGWAASPCHWPGAKSSRRRSRASSTAPICRSSTSWP